MISRKLNTDMRTAMRNKADEFYTMKEDIEKEIIHYKSYIKGKTVYCCCDSQESNFTVFFKEHFNDYHIKMLITSSLYENIMTVYQYDGSENKIIFSEEVEDIHDFESIKKYISISDVIITNPPFSKFRNFFNILIESGKKFLIIGNMNQILTKDIFKYVVSGDVFWGVSIHSGDRLFKVPDDYPLNASNFTEDETGKYIRVKGIRWFTNIKPDNGSETKYIELTCSCKKLEYKKFDYIDAICVDKTKDIPYDYYGLMGVPLTFFDKYNSEQFEIIDGVNRYLLLDSLHINETAVKNKWHLLTVDGKIKYFRILIKRR